MKIIRRTGPQYSITKDGSRFAVSRTITTYDTFQEASRTMLDLLRKRKTEEEVRGE